MGIGERSGGVEFSHALATEMIADEIADGLPVHLAGTESSCETTLARRSAAFSSEMRRDDHIGKRGAPIANTYQDNAPTGHRTAGSLTV